MLQFNETNGTSVSGIESVINDFPHGKIIPKCVINQENANKPICTCYLEVRHRSGLKFIVEATLFYPLNVAYVLHLFIFFQKLHFSETL